MLLTVLYPACRRVGIAVSRSHQWRRYFHQFRSPSTATFLFYYEQLIGQRFSRIQQRFLQSRRKTAVTATSDLDNDSSDDEIGQTAIDQPGSSTGQPVKGEAHYFYRLANIDFPYNKTDIHSQRMLQLVGYIESARCLTMNGAPFRTKLIPKSQGHFLHEQLSKAWITRRCLLVLLPVLNSLPNRWNSTNIDETTLNEIGEWMNDFTVKRLLPGFSSELRHPDYADWFAILNTFTNFYSPSTVNYHSIITRFIQVLGEQSSLRFLGSNSPMMSNEQLIYLLFAIGLHRIMPVSIKLDLENELLKRYETLTPQQLLVGAYAFYRTDTAFDGRRLLDLILEQYILSDQVDSSYGGLMVLKLLKLNARFEFASAFSKFANIFIEKPISAYSFHYWSHFASACREMRYYNVDLAEKMLEKMLTEMEQLRLKDVVLIWNYLTIMNHPLKKDILVRMMSYLRQSWPEEWMHLPVRALYGLSLKDNYPLDLISRVLNREYLSGFPSKRKTMEKVPVRALFWLDCSVAIERPDYNGPRMDLALLQRPDIAALLKDTVNIQPPASVVTQSYMANLSVAAHLIQLVLGCESECVFQGLILPHSPLPGLLVKLKENKPVPVKVDQSIRNIKYDEMRVPEGQQWIALLLQTDGNCKWQSKQFLGHHLAHQRHLEKLGYKVLVVSYTSLPKKPTTAAVKRFEQFFKVIRDKADQSCFYY